MMKYPKLKAASAGSGKTYTLTEIIFENITNNTVRPEEIIATTFTVKAANEIKSRIREKLITEGRTQEANRINAALIGTLNSIALQLVQRFAIETGISPNVETVTDEEQSVIIREIISSLVDSDFYNLTYRLSQDESFNSTKPKWMGYIEDIIAAAKVNNISADALRQMKQLSIDDFLDIVGKDDGIAFNDFRDQLNPAIITILESIQYLELASTKKDDFKKLEACYWDMENETIKYSQFGFLQKIEFPKKCKVVDETEHLNHIANKITSVDHFRKDVEQYITKIFDIASQTIKTYDQIKREKGLLDFADQEAELYALLADSDRVKSILAENYKLLIWDEFQDSSPLQGAIFFKLTEILDHTYCLLDNKQSIYSFRNASPKLIAGIINSIPAEHKSQLPHSYRSNAPLVNFTNMIFEDVFDMPRDEIVLSPADSSRTKRDAQIEDTLKSRVNVWRFLKGGNNKDYQVALINNISAFINEGHLVFDRVTRQYRPANYGDVMILARTNSKINAIAKLCMDANIPVASGGTGLYGEPETIYICAILKLLVFPNDSLAKAEILLYSIFNGMQEEMIMDRLKVEKTWEWHQELPLWQEMIDIRSQIQTLSLTELLHFIFEHFELGRLFAAWGNLPQRMANYEALLKHTQGYLDKCRSLNNGSSILGLLGHLGDMSNESADEKGEYLGPALRIMTYHRSKGLEANIVVLWNLDEPLKNKFGGVNSYGDDQVDIGNILNNRRIIFRPYPFGGQKTIVGWTDKLEEMPKYQQAVQEAMEEEQRLLYVGMTRARDYLIFGMKKLESKKENYILENISDKLQFASFSDGVDHESFQFDGSPIPVRFETHQVDKGEELDIQSSETSHLFFKEPVGRKEYTPLNIRPSDESTTECAILATDTIHEAIPIDNSIITDRARGDFFHNIFAAIHPDTPEKQGLNIIKHTAQVFGMPVDIDHGRIYKNIQVFYDYVNTQYPTSRVYKELPVLGKTEEGQQISGFVDFLIETDDHLILIDFKSFNTPEWHDHLYSKKTMSFNGQLDRYANILAQSFNKPVKHKYIYYCIMGRLQEVATDGQLSTIKM